MPWKQRHDNNIRHQSIPIALHFHDEFGLFTAVYKTFFDQHWELSQHQRINCVILAIFTQISNVPSWRRNRPKIIFQAEQWNLMCVSRDVLCFAVCDLCCRPPSCYTSADLTLTTCELCGMKRSQLLFAADPAHHDAWERFYPRSFLFCAKIQHQNICLGLWCP